MVSPYQQLDKRFAKLKPLATEAVRPTRGWIRAIRTALGMTTGQLARRMGVAQPRIIEIERGEAEGNITLKTLQRAAEALGCRLVYVLVPEHPLEDTLRERASLIADQQLASVEQTMRLEAQEVHDAQQREQTRRRLADELLTRPARLWDEP
jgi:predicted DNA-binding mobile mystery protein A